MMKRSMNQPAVALLFALGLALSLGAPSAASACSCLETSLAAARAAATVVFEGELTAIEDPTPGGTHTAVFRVRRVWKGQVARIVRMPINHPSMCPPHFVVGERYILYPTGSFGALQVASCARSASHSTLADERRNLGRPIRRYR